VHQSGNLDTDTLHFNLQFKEVKCVVGDDTLHAWCITFSFQRLENI